MERIILLLKMINITLTEQVLDIYINSEKFITTSGFNLEEVDTVLGIFLYQYDLKNLVKDGIYFKNATQPSCID